jgi:hypothetical protein
MDKFEKLVLEIVKDAEADGEPVTREEAEAMAIMELGAKENVKRYEQSDKPRKKSDKPKTVKVSDAKKALFVALHDFLTEFGAENGANVSVLTENKLISVEFGGETFKIDLIQQRKPKK